MTKPTGRPRGGFRENAGRKISPLRTAKIAEQIMERSLKDFGDDAMMPLDFLLRVMNNDEFDFSLRFESAKAAAPYCHARLQSVQVNNPDENKLTIVFQDFSRNPEGKQLEVTAPRLALDAAIDAAQTAHRSNTARSAALASILDDDEQDEND